MLGFAFLNYAECRNVGCRHAECRGARKGGEPNRNGTTGSGGGTGKARQGGKPYSDGKTEWTS